jgi:hypothetical protein
MLIRALWKLAVAVRPKGIEAAAIILTKTLRSIGWKSGLVTR